MVCICSASRTGQQSSTSSSTIHLEHYMQQSNTGWVKSGVALQDAGASTYVVSQVLAGEPCTCNCSPPLAGSDVVQHLVPSRVVLSCWNHSLFLLRGARWQTKEVLHQACPPVQGPLSQLPAHRLLHCVLDDLVHIIMYHPASRGAMSVTL